MLKQKHTQNIFKNKASLLILILFLSSLSSFFPIKKASAWDALKANTALFGMESIKKYMEEVILAGLKQAAYRMILEETDKLITDMMNIGTAFITDWEDYLINAPERESAKFMNDLLSNVDQGRSSSRYRSVPVSVTLSYANVYEGFGAQSEYQFALIKSAQAQDEDENYYNEKTGDFYYDIKQMGAMAIETNQKSFMPEITCTDEMRNNYFTNNLNFDDFWECTEGANYGPTLNAFIQSKYTDTLAENKAKAATEAGSSGYQGAKNENNQTYMPAGTLEAIANKAQTMGMDILAQAKSVPELITAAVVNAVNRSIQQGIGAIKARLQNEMAKARGKLTNQMRQAAREYGPAATFNNR